MKRNFGLLWAGQLFSQSGDRLTQMVLVALVAAVQPGSSLVLAQVMAATSLPALLVGPIAGAYVDRWDRKKTMIVCDLLRCGMILILPWLAAPGRRGFFYADLFSLYAVASFFVPARLAMIPDLVPPDRLAKANAIFTTSGMVGSAVILLVGALLVEWAGTARACWVNAFAYLASAACILPIVGKRPGPPEREESPQKIFTEVWEGIRELWGHESTRRVVGLLGLLVAGASASAVMGTVIIQKWLGSVTKDLGFLSLWCGVGMFLGTVVYGRWGTNNPRRVVLAVSFLGSAAALGLFLGAVVGLRSGAAASVAAGLLGFCVAPAGIVTNTLVHEAHPERLHGRIFSSLGIVVNVSLIGSMLTAGWLGEQIGKERLLAGIALLFATAGAALLYYGRKCQSNKENSGWATQP